MKISDKTIERALSSGIRLSQVGDNIIISAKAGTDDAHALYRCSSKGAHFKGAHRVNPEEFCYWLDCEDTIIGNLDGFGHIFRNHYGQAKIKYAVDYTTIFIDDWGQVQVRWDKASTVRETRKLSGQYDIPDNAHKHKGAWVLTSSFLSSKSADKVEAHFRSGKKRWADPIHGRPGTSAAMAWMQKAGAPGDVMKEIARAYHGCW